MLARTEIAAIDPALSAEMLCALPRLRAFAISLCRDADRADDLVQETVLRALTNMQLFEPGTNMQAWLFTILRNLFYSEHRRRRREALVAMMERVVLEWQAATTLARW